MIITVLKFKKKLNKIDWKKINKRISRIVCDICCLNKIVHNKSIKTPFFNDV